MTAGKHTLVPMNRARLRLGRHSRIGQSYILTTVTQGRRHYFDDATAAQVVMEVIRRLDADGGSTPKSRTVVKGLRTSGLAWRPFVA
ncbi:hypothetical protein U5F73_16060, partial [Stenotrophomonas pavanii]|nr:hypothetical protein [Stenotrophomonas pavanii]